jgi:hypothetical protein
MGRIVRCLIQSVFLTFLTIAVAHSDEAIIDCSKLGSHLDPALLTGMYSEDIRSTTTALIPEEKTNYLNRQSVSGRKANKTGACPYGRRIV